MISVVTGPIRSGKTTRLASWLRRQQQAACGFLTPDGAAGLRVLFDLDANNTLPFQLPCDGTEKTIDIGPFCFSSRTFAHARTVIADAAERMPALMVVDEVGKLELGGSGFEPELANLIRTYRVHPNSRLVLVVRDTLLVDVQARYRLDTVDILDDLAAETNDPSG